jgi:glycosyltransferase involved in cell wall biosynthesis
MAPTLSIVMPTFQRPDFIEEAILSVCAQEWCDWELSVYDDGDARATRDIIRRLRDPRITYSVNTARLGAGGNKLAGWQRARGKYISNLDDDDVWEPQFLSTLVPVLEADPSLAVAFSAQHVIDQYGALDSDRTKANQIQYRGNLTPGRHWPITRLALVDRALPIATGSVIRRQVVDWCYLPDTCNIHADFWLAYLLVRSNGAAFYCDDELVRYRIHNRSVTALAGVDGLPWHSS